MISQKILDDRSHCRRADKHGKGPIEKNIRNLIVKKKIKIENSDSKDQRSKYIFASIFIFLGLLSLLMRPDYNSLSIKTLMIEGITLQGEGDYARLEFLAEGQAEPFIFSGTSHELTPLYESLMQNHPPPVTMTFWIAPAFLGFGSMQRILGIDLKQKRLIEPRGLIESKRRHFLQTGLILLAVGVCFTLAIYKRCDDWIWRNED
ncbi:MAG: hypothetical protein A2X86_15690 [Bdellovibrionales bacterium GWA2_49_15]|nr:MAG: hypothetical protein A2X86_15690 [Bdellovibrionales bacterium GWA2_49_15]HAZ14573.1 hypothetical protein [Bdellovibrionales bacterium]